MNLLKKLRPALSLILLFMALAAGVYYLATHRNLLRQLSHTHLSVLLAVFGLYVIMFGVLVLILSASLKLCARHLGSKENAKLNVYSLLLNFFVPGQSGPAYRGAYLYKRHNLRVKSYIGITLIYYLFYALISLFLLLLTRFAWWQTLLALVIMAGLGLAVIRRYSARTKFLQASLSLSPTNGATSFGKNFARSLPSARFLFPELSAFQTGLSRRCVIVQRYDAQLNLHGIVMALLCAETAT